MDKIVNARETSTEQRGSRSRFRFSLRALLIAFALVAGICYWLILPTIEAERFVRAVDSGDFKSADACFHRPEDRFFVTWKEKNWAFKPQAELESWSFTEFVEGRRRVAIRITYGNHGQLHGLEGTAIATRSGVRSPDFTDIRFGGMSI
jgi:hypothetical protein